MNYIKPKFWETNNLIVLLLWPLTLVTRLIIFLKNFKEPYQSKISTICIGNIYLGGTGKTQLSIKVNDILKKKYKTFVVKKDYKDQIDEQRLLNKYTNLVLTKFRANALKNIERSKKSIAIFDDGLQDKSLKYKISIVCFNCFDGIGNGKILPAGPLREDLSKLRNYSAVFLNGDNTRFLKKKIKEVGKNIKIFNGKYVLNNKKEFKMTYKYLAFCGIGSPENFFNLLKKNKINFKKKIIFPDHYNYNNSDISKIKKIAKENNLKIITTEKDYMKIKKFKNFKVKYANVDLKINKYYFFKKFLLDNL